MDGKLSLVYVPVRDTKEALAFYRDQLGLVESWREGETVAFKLPGTEVELMVDPVEEGTHDTAGPMFQLPSVDEFYAAHQGKLEFVRKPSDIAPGRWAAAKDPSGNMLYFFDTSKSG
jgi:catechol 2,3-dioxygenase-like lactoylglutathione lyase family enzyme